MQLISQWCSCQTPEVRFTSLFLYLLDALQTACATYQPFRRRWQFKRTKSVLCEHMEQYNRFELSRSVWRTEMLPLHQYCKYKQLTNQGGFALATLCRLLELCHSRLTVIDVISCLCNRPYIYYWIRTNIFENSTLNAFAVTPSIFISLILYLRAISHSYPRGPFSYWQPALASSIQALIEYVWLQTARFMRPRLSGEFHVCMVRVRGFEPPKIWA